MDFAQGATYMFIIVFNLVTSLTANIVDTSTINNTNLPPWERSNRIPSFTNAVHYNLFIHPNLQSKTFTGTVTITITTTEATDFFLVNVNQLLIKNSTLSLRQVKNGYQTDVPILQAFEYIPNQFYVIQTPNVPRGKYELYMEFLGSLQGKIVGFYSSEYMTKSNKTRLLATTKFQPTYAREAFPCFDEPSFRSTFKITLVRPSGDGYIGLNNMPIEKEIPDSPSQGLTEIHFEESLSMVTYLVCFIVCDFTYKQEIHATMSGEIPFRVYAPADKIENMNYALTYGVKTLMFYEAMFNYPFPMPKSDMAAIPDYSSGATEHWGLITYRETRILYNEATSSTRDYQSVSMVIAHELAHQWFGNLVTLKWWNDLWLNEGFASYIEYKGTDFNHPSWDMRAQFIVDRVQKVFELDSKLSCHPIVQKVQTPEEINSMFDSISYDKGASILRMLEGFMGEEDFQEGINQFLKIFAFQTAVTQDLWDTLTDAWKDDVQQGEKSDIGEIMDTWTIQMGYPVVNVQRTKPTELTIVQSRFLMDPNAKYNDSDSPFHYKWDIPISLITSSQSDSQNYWLYREMEQLVIDIEESITWFKLNHEQIGYYRVNYDSQTWAQLQDLCASMSLIAEDRSSLYDDALSLADAAKLDYEVALNLTQSLIHEQHYVPWKSASRKFETMQYLLLQTDAEDPLKSYLTELLKPMYDKLQWQDQGTHLERLLRSVIVDLASRSGLRSSLDEAGRFLQLWIDDESYPLPVDQRRLIYWWGMIESGSNENWEIMWQRCMAELDASQKDDLYYGLANSQDPLTLNKYIELTFNLNNTRMQDFLSILEYISLNPVGMGIAWNWTRVNWDLMIERYGTNDRYLGQLIPDITNHFKTPISLVEMEEFYQENGDTGVVAEYQEQALDTVKNNIYWVNAYTSTILEWLTSR